MKLKKSLVAALFAGSTILAASSANAFFGGWGPWNWFDDDDWYDYPPPWVYGAYPYAPYYGYGYAPYYGYGAYPYGYGAYPYAYPYATAPATTAPTQQNSK